MISTHLKYEYFRGVKKESTRGAKMSQFGSP